MQFNVRLALLQLCIRKKSRVSFDTISNFSTNCISVFFCGKLRLITTNRHEVLKIFPYINFLLYTNAKTICENLFKNHN